MNPAIIEDNNVNVSRLKRIIENTMIELEGETLDDNAEEYIRDVILATLKYFEHDKPFNVICDARNNTPESIENHELHVDVILHGSNDISLTLSPSS